LHICCGLKLFTKITNKTMWYRNKHSGKLKEFPAGWYEANTGGQTNSNWEKATKEEVEKWLEQPAKEEEPTDEAGEPTLPTTPKVSGGKPVTIPESLPPVEPAKEEEPKADEEEADGGSSKAATTKPTK
jgi:hypothetical protein